jgi:hypothetical protein
MRVHLITAESPGSRKLRRGRLIQFPQRPGRSRDRRTAEFLDEACVDVATVSMVVPMPGTPTFRRLCSDGRILTTDWAKYDGKKHCVFQPALMSPAELEAGTEWVARRFYSLRSTARRLAGSRVGLWWSLLRNVGYMLAGLSNAGPSWDPAAGHRVTGSGRGSP